MSVPPGPGPDPTLWVALRASAAALFDDLGRFVLANGAWLLAGAVGVGLGLLHVLGNVLLVLLIPATAGLTRMAAFTVRGQVATLGQFRAGLRARWPFAPLLGMGQAVAALVAWINFQIGMTAATLPLVAAAVASAWVLLAVACSAVAVWPLLLDPERDPAPAGQVIRLALRVGAARPGRLILVVSFETLLALVSLQVLLAAVLLPSLGVLFAAHAVVPVADRLEGRQPA